MAFRARSLTCRAVLHGSAAALAAGVAAMPLRRAWAAYPERHLKVVIPTAQGGGDHARTFNDIRRKPLGAQ